LIQKILKNKKEKSKNLPESSVTTSLSSRKEPRTKIEPFELLTEDNPVAPSWEFLPGPNGPLSFSP
jgi:hypothetical protein